MKTSIIFISALVFLNVLRAQEYKVNVENPGESKLSLEGFTGEIIIEGYTGKEIVFSSPDLDIDIPDRAKGLKPVYSGGTDNTGLGLAVNKSGTEVEVLSLLPFTNTRDFNIKVPETMALKIKSECQYNTEINISKMKNEVEINTCHDITMKDVSGPLVLSTISGDINLTFTTLIAGKPFSISNISGEIDITLPQKAPVDIEMQSVTGTMYSDFDFPNSEKDMKRIGGNELSYRLNGGGTKFSIVNVSGNIYLRKGQ